MAPTFLDLAREIRDLVYVEAFVSPTGIITHHSADAGAFWFYQYPETFPGTIISLALLSTCHQIRDEAMPLFLTNALHITHLEGVDPMSQSFIAKRLRKVEIHLKLNMNNSLWFSSKIIVLNRWPSLREVCMDIKLWDSEELEHALVDQTTQPPTGRILRHKIRAEGLSAVLVARMILLIAGQLQMPIKLMLDTKTSPGISLEAGVRRSWLEDSVDGRKASVEMMKNELSGAFENEV